MEEWEDLVGLLTVKGLKKQTFCVSVFIRLSWNFYVLIQGDKVSPKNKMIQVAATEGSYFSYSLSATHLRQGEQAQKLPLFDDEWHVFISY